MRVKWKVVEESKYIIHLVGEDVELEQEDLEELAAVGLSINNDRSPKNAFAKGIHWGRIHIAMNKTERFAGWQP